jgi:formate-dependent nitrite reductase cytochrome c552 subunit
MGTPVAPPPDAPPTAATLHPVAVRKPAGPPVVKAGYTDDKGRPVTIACATCHATKDPNPQARLGEDLKLFHQGLKGAHGNLACVSCHNPGDKYDSLRLADGRPLPYAEVMQLCAQCHGPQYRDYQHGAHGGMTGHWDLTKGGRVRNNCIDCHDPHAPKYPTVRPAAGPHDRGGVHPNAGEPRKGAGHE